MDRALHAPTWLADSGLALDAAGYVRVGATLQSANHPDVFAAGDLIVRDDAPHPRNGVYALRAGPVLAENLRRHAAGSPGTAVAFVGPFTLVKRVIDRLDSIGWARAAGNLASVDEAISRAQTVLVSVESSHATRTTLPSSGFGLKK